MTRKEPASMLDAAAPALPKHPALSLITPAALLSLSGDTAGLTLPATPRCLSFGEDLYIWSGPGAWLVMSADASFETRLRNMAPAAKITLQTDGRTLLRFDFPAARAVLAKLVPIDLHESAFPGDATALTIAAHIPVQIWRDGDAFVLACFRSYARALADAILEALPE
jgi:sarcosine oxidase subunit gamma